MTNWVNWVTTFIDRWQLFTLWTCRQLDVELSWVELRRCRYRHFADATQLNSTSSWAELCCVAINGPLRDGPAILRTVCTSESADHGLSFCRWQSRFIFIHLWSCTQRAPEKGDTRSSGNLRSLKSFKLVKIETNRKPVCDFLLVPRQISHHLRNIATQR